MNGKRLFHKIKLANLLSFGPEAEEIELEPLNVLIGPNASGKSNLIDAIRWLWPLPTAPIGSSGGMTEWLWKGGADIPVATIAVTVDCPKTPVPLDYRISFTGRGQRMELVDESIRGAGETPSENEVYYRFETGSGAAEINTVDDLARKDGQRTHSRIDPKDLDPNASILSQRKDPARYPEITYLARAFLKMRLYFDWSPQERGAPPRTPAPADLPADFLVDHASNLALVLNDLDNRGFLAPIEDRLRKCFEDFTRLTMMTQANTIGIFFHQEGLRDPISAARVSDGTLRYLCLLAILCHPEPPPLVCIEEPELGLHPDCISSIAELLVEASKRTQLIVTTHSDFLVSALSETPEAILVCERDASGSHLRRLEPDRMKTWLEKYSLGELWMMGELGGTRW